MPAASVLAPSALLAAAAASGWVLERCGVLVSRWLAAGAAWLALAVLLATWWATGRATLELNLPGTLAGAPLALRLDAIGVAFGLVVLLPVALLFTFQRLCSGLLPWPSWLPAMWDRERLEAGSLALALLGPIGFLLLARAYLLGAGQWPSPALNVALAAVGVAAAAAAALRAQAAPNRTA